MKDKLTMNDEESRYSSNSGQTSYFTTNKNYDEKVRPISNNEDEIKFNYRFSDFILSNQREMKER